MVFNALQEKASFNYEKQAENKVVHAEKRKSAGDRAFEVAGPRFWNSLPIYLQNIQEIKTFKISLKTYLFKLCFGVFDFNKCIIILII